jgi:CRISPR type III-A-associated protein Csm2
MFKNAVNGENYCDKAEAVMRSLGRPSRNDPARLEFILTTSKIRNLLSMVNQIYNDVILSDAERLEAKYSQQIIYLRVRMLYESGREPAVSDFFKKSGLLDMVNEIKDDKSKFLLFCRYLEALVAYHRFLGGRD